MQLATKLSAITLLILTFSLTSFGQEGGGGSYRMERKVGFGLTLNDSLPGEYGMAIFIQPVDWVSLQIGGGFATEGLGSSVVSEIGTTMITAMVYLMALTLVKWNDIRDFVRGDENNTVGTVFTWNGGVNFFVPGWNLSPTVGLGVAGWEADNQPFGLADTGSHIYYKVGLDWQSRIGFRIAVGWAHAPKLTQPLQDKAYGNIGWIYKY